MRTGQAAAPIELYPQSSDPETLARIARSVRFLTQNREQMPSLDEAAAQAGLSPSHFQRVFTRHVGISPKRFVAHLTLETAKLALSESEPVLGAAFEAGLSGPGRLHDLFVTHEAITPGEFKAQGRGLELAYGFAPTPFGLLLCVASERGIVGLAFADESAPEGAAPRPIAAEGEDLWSPETALADMKARFPNAHFVENAEAAGAVAAALFGGKRSEAPLKLVLTGTNFQVRVWQALLELPVGYTTTYSKLAQAIGRADATRAVASAVGRNPISLIIPCHRVLRSDGGLGGYHWGLSRKRALLAWERAHTGESVAAV